MTTEPADDGSSSNIGMSAGSVGVIERAKAIILKPKAEWPVIEREFTSSGDIFTRYVVPLAAIGPVATFLGGQIFGYSAWIVSFRPSFMWSLSTAIISFVMALVSVFIVSLIADKLASNFGGESSSRNAFKLVAYSMTAAWVAGIFGILPSLGILGILGLYSFYLFFTGAGVMMKVPKEQVATYSIVTLICAILVNVVVGSLAYKVGGMFAGPSLLDGTISSSDGDATVSVPGVGTIDTGKIQQAAKDMEAAASGTTVAVAPSDLQALLPASIGSYQRTAVESQKAGPASSAEGTYEAGGKRFTLKVTDMTAIGAIAGMASAFGVESNKEDATSYEKTSSKDGNFMTEKWDKSDLSGSFMQMVGKRYAIEAEGGAASIDELKAAVASVDQGKLISLGGK